jgi:hypothetical protein
MRIAIGHDLVRRDTDGNSQSFSAVWKARADELGIATEELEPLLPGALDRIARCDGFIWRYNFKLPWTDAGPRLMQAVENELGIPVWPARPLRDTFENKIAQSYLLEAAGIPHPRTWVFWRQRDAMAALPDLPFPLVAKLSRGVKSDGVALIRDRAEAEVLVRQMFSFGTLSLDFLRIPRHRRFGKYTPILRAMRRGGIRGNLEQGYVLLQEYIPGNTGDTRVVVQGDVAVAGGRLNREGDFRASGSGRNNLDPANINPKSIELGFRLADAMGVSSVVLDVLVRGDEPVITEFSASMAINAVRRFRGHWRRGPDGLVRSDDPVDWPNLVFDEFVAEVRAHRSGGARVPLAAVPDAGSRRASPLSASRDESSDVGVGEDHRPPVNLKMCGFGPC